MDSRRYFKTAWGEHWLKGITCIFVTLSIYTYTFQFPDLGSLGLGTVEMSVSGNSHNSTDIVSAK